MKVNHHFFPVRTKLVRFIALIACTAILAGMLISCANDKKPTESTGKTETTADKIATTEGKTETTADSTETTDGKTETTSGKIDEPDNLFTAFYGEDVYSTENDQKYIQNNVASTENESIRLSVDSMFADNHYCTVIYSVEILDDTKAEDLPECKLEFSGPGLRESAYQSSGDTNPDMNTATRFYYLEYVRRDIPLESFTVTCGDLHLDVQISSAPVLHGRFEEGAVSGVEVSPISLWVEFFSTDDSKENVGGDGMPTHDIAIKYRDGSTVGATKEQFENREHLKLGWGNAEQRLTSNNQPFLTISFNEFQKIEDVTAVVIDGVEYVVDGN